MRRLPLLLFALLLIAALAFGVSAMFGTGAREAAPSGAAAQGGGGGDGDEVPKTPSPHPQGHVYAGVTEEPGDVNPFTAHSTVAQFMVLAYTHEGLVDTDPRTGQLRGALASAWQAAPDGMSCTFTLRSGVRFSDGSPVTMADVLFGWELAQGGGFEMGFVHDAFSRVANAAVVGERQLRVRFRECHYASVRAVGESWLVGQRSFFVDRVRALATQLGQPVPTPGTVEFGVLLAQLDRVTGPGTGPMQLPSDPDPAIDDSPGWRQRQDLTLSVNPFHWRRLAEPGCWNLAGVRLLFRQGAAVPNALFEGEVDWLGAWTADQFLATNAELAERYRYLVYDYESLGVIGIAWNCDQPALADPRVRRALTMLIDRGAIVERFGSAVVPAVAFQKPDNPGYPDLQPIAYDPGAARRLLREAGFDPAAGKPLKLSLLAPRDGGPMDLAVNNLQDEARQAGIELTVETLASFAAYVARKNERQWGGLVVNRRFRPWDDPFDFVHENGIDNDGHWQSAEASRLAAAARQALDPDQRARLWRQLHELVYGQQPFTFLVHPRACILFNKHVQQADIGPRGLWPERWWVPAEHQRK